MAGKIFAALMLATCAVLLLRLLIGERRRWRLDAALRRGWTATGRRWTRTRLKVVTLWRWRASHRAAVAATEQAIRRARESATGTSAGTSSAAPRPDNVVRPDAFRKPPNDKLH